MRRRNTRRRRCRKANRCSRVRSYDHDPSNETTACRIDTHHHHFALGSDSQGPPAPVAYDLQGVIARVLEANPTISAAGQEVTTAQAQC